MPSRTSTMLMASALLVGAIALFAAPAVAHDQSGSNTYVAKLLPTYYVPRRMKAPTGTATVTFYNATSAVLMWEVKNIENCTMMHIHNGTLTMPGNVVVWAFQTTLPPTGAFNPVTGSFSGTVMFDPMATGSGDLIMNNMAYFNVHTVEYPGGAINGMFMQKDC